MRTRGILLIRDAIFVLGVYPSQSKLRMVRSELKHDLKVTLATLLEDWRTLCNKLIGQLQAHTDALQKHLEWFTSIGDKESSDVIRSNCISCLAYLANLYLTIAPTDYPTAPTMEFCCDNTLSALGRLTEGMVMEEYSYFDLLLGVSKSPPTRAYLSPRQRRCAGKELWRGSGLVHLSFRWKRPPSWFDGGRLLPIHTHCTRRNFLTANLPCSPLCLYLRMAERRIRSIQTSYLLRHEQRQESDFFSLFRGIFLATI
jgi:hypothetical protein